MKKRFINHLTVDGYQNVLPCTSQTYKIPYCNSDETVHFLIFILYSSWLSNTHPTSTLRHSTKGKKEVSSIVLSTGFEDKKTFSMTPETQRMATTIPALFKAAGGPSLLHFRKEVDLSHSPHNSERGQAWDSQRQKERPTLFPQVSSYILSFF